MKQPLWKNSSGEQYPARTIPIHLYTTDPLLTQLDELEISPFADGQADRFDLIAALGPDDFQRIGVQPTETRLAVIRRAASRAAKSLAKRQLRAPNPLTEQQLSRIAVSTYRILDPRQRNDRQSQTHVGRIRPVALLQAGHASFADGRSLSLTGGPGESATASHNASKFDNETHGDASAGPPTVAQKVDLNAIFPIFNPTASFSTRFRRCVRRPDVMISIIIALLSTAATLWIWLS